ncbi:venom factor-like isoform X2 [Engystomops pustulosus]|uniref:venom factor-like isoform X2 n=1 Tax=Engystomops pustulosus TaxID=76066 RepID=UPI003AFA819C
MGCRLLCVTLLALLARCYGQPCTLITPSVLHRDSDETIVLDGHTTAFEADVVIQDFPRRNLQLSKQKISLNNGNNFLGTATVRIPSKDLAKDPKTKQYVYVTVTSPVCNLEKVVLLGHQSGYAFIQTDKTIYTPGSAVLYRIFNIDDKMSPVDAPLVVYIQTPENTVVSRDSVNIGNSGINSYYYKLPEVSSLGVWTISVHSEKSQLKMYSTSFEVKEYVLPRFEIQLIPEQKYFYVDDPEYAVNIRAQFLYGKPVDGMAFVLFGVKKDGTRTSLPDTQRRIPISGGEGQVVLKREDLVKSFPNPNDLLQCTLYMSVTLVTDSGNSFMESKLEDIPIVKSPYNVLFTKTSKYFKPGLPFDLMVYVTNPDGSPAQRVPVVAEPGRAISVTGPEGTARLTLNTGSDTRSLLITVRTSHPALHPARQASASMTANAHQSGGNYLHIGVTPSEVKPGDNLAVNLFTRNNNAALQNQIQHFTYLITTKGRIVKVGRQPQSLVTMSLPITGDLIPSFRIIAYYIVGNEIVSDSTWVEVTDSCMGTLSLTENSKRDSAIQRPGSSMSLKLQVDHMASVGLVVVDKGVHVLNKKYKISQKKMMDSVEKSDTGCTPGGGANSMGVFYDAGLALQSTLQSTTQQRSEQQCEVRASRRRRSPAQEIYQKITNASSSQEMVRRCCIDGMNEKGENCEGRAANIWEGRECADAFLHCCKFIRQKKEKERNPTEPDAETRGSQYEVTASRRRRSDEDEEYILAEEIISSTEFPESWFWRIDKIQERPDINGISTKLLNVFLKDSVTTWEVQAVSLSPNKGICVSEPYEIRVLKEFFIDLELPYSVVRNEQVEIRAVLYNYGRTTIKVRVEQTHNPQFCSLSTAKSNFRQVVEIRPQSSVAVPFILIPLSLGSHDVEVKAAVFGQYLSDGVRKKLKVVPSGVQLSKIIKSVTLDPQVAGKDGVQEVKVPALDEKNLVPGTNVETIVTIQAQRDNSYVDELHLDVSIAVPEKPIPLRYLITSENAMLARTAVTKLNKEFVVSARGKGQATLKVISVYHTTETEKELCRNFDLSVTVKEEANVRAPDGVLSTKSVEICTRYLKDRDATLSILEVSMMTGFTPDFDSLNKLKREADRYISHFEINNKDNKNGPLIIYLDKISHRKDECIKFNVHQIFKVNLIQQGSVTVYDYYSPENRCSKFYHVEMGSKSLDIICLNDMCQCATENCYALSQLEGEVDAVWRFDRACTSGVDYVYKAHLEEIQKNDNYDNYVMKIITVIKEGSDDVVLNKKRNFVSHIRCRKSINLTVGRDYLIWGLESDLWQQPDGFSYLIGRDTWIEWWPNDRECQDPENTARCDNLYEFSEELSNAGCFH